MQLEASVLTLVDHISAQREEESDLSQHNCVQECSYLPGIVSLLQVSPPAQTDTH